MGHCICVQQCPTGGNSNILNPDLNTGLMNAEKYKKNMVREAFNFST